MYDQFRSELQKVDTYQALIDEHINGIKGALNPKAFAYAEQSSFKNRVQEEAKKYAERRKAGQNVTDEKLLMVRVIDSVAIIVMHKDSVMMPDETVKFLQGFTIENIVDFFELYDAS